MVNIELLHDKELKNFSNLSYSGKIYQYLILYFIKKFKTIICVSKNTKKILTKFLDVNDKNIFKIYNTLNDTFYKVSLKEKNFFLKKNNLSFSFFLHVGANVWYKNKINLIKIFFEIIKITRRKNFKLVLISNSFSNDLKSLIKELNLEKKIFLFKNVKLKDLRCFYSSAEALILPSIREGFGWPIIEAQKCLCPVFTINKSPMNELGLDSVFYLDSKNPKKSALLIDRLLKKKKSLIKKGKKNVNRFNSNIFFKEMSIVYNRYL